MLSYLQGTLLNVQGDLCSVLIQGMVGFEVFIGATTALILQDQLGQPVALFVHTIWREQLGPILFGFLEERDCRLFAELIQINGVGPKTACALIGHLGAQALVEAARQQRAQMLQRVPGVGKKTAERLVLELHGKLQKMLSVVGDLPQQPNDQLDAIQALQHLGYAMADAERAVRRAAEEGAQGVSALITEALQLVGSQAGITTSG